MNAKLTLFNSLLIASMVSGCNYADASGPAQEFEVSINHDKPFVALQEFSVQGKLYPHEHEGTESIGKAIVWLEGQEDCSLQVEVLQVNEDGQQWIELGEIRFITPDDRDLGAPDFEEGMTSKIVAELTTEFEEQLVVMKEAV
ncbi:hypothetical protein [Acinetobacter radioresistens]|uniref:hypothetical protein n=1 Tax=Acinetobacter radioresistens TaxID=40216 RepID=UPI0021CD61C4|nr:hypothetical protein [Acinetobacter radioresistens]MCU4517927.1 hypothetical protein [Acinetobacter radioresistens]